MWTSPITDKENVRTRQKQKDMCALHFFCVTPFCHLQMWQDTITCTFCKRWLTARSHSKSIKLRTLHQRVFMRRSTVSVNTRVHEQLNNSRAVVAINIIFAPKNSFLCTLLPLMWSWLLKFLLVCSLAERGSIIKDQHNGSVTSLPKGSQCFSHFTKLHDSAHFSQKHCAFSD